ncbi:MAG: hypothetical protein IJ662_09400 [Clostridia bacterium]|nr:hypothetical protein [Clostridia bacterium]
MKRMTILALLLLLMALPAALADGAALDGVDMPSEIQTYFSTANFNHYTISPTGFLPIEHTAAGNYFFAITQYDGHNVLHLFQQKNGKYEHILRTDKALPQGDGFFHLNRLTGSIPMASGSSLSLGDGIGIRFSLADWEEQQFSFTAFEIGKNGVWTLRKLTYHGDEAVIGESGVTYYFEGEKLGRANGEVQTDLRYFSFASFPKSLHAAREKLSSPPALPASSQLQAKNVKFTGGKKYAVYTGPGKDFYRAADGKAAVSTNDWIQVFGYEDDWILIQYDITADHLRFGWIPRSTLPKGADVGPLNLGDQTIILRQDTFLTDDPLKSRSRLEALAAGRQITWLATMGDWYYVQDEETRMRGFVPASAAAAYEINGSVGAYTGSYADSVYAASARAEIGSRREARVTIEGSAPGGWLNARDAIVDYQIYGNNTLLAQTDPLFTRTAAPDGLCRFSLSCSVSIPRGVNVLGLCPVYPDGVRTAEAVLIFLDP